MAASRLGIYNEALRICGERKLASLSENRPPRHYLDDVWDADGVRRCLEKAQWKHAMRTQQIDYDPDVTPQFGLRYAFAKPTDWVATAGVCSDEHFRVPLDDFEDEAGYWYSDLDTLYVRYVSDDSAYGMNLALWPGAFTKFVATYFAGEIILKLTSDEKKQSAIVGPRGLLARALSDAKSTDAQGGPPRWPAQGAWSSSRQGRIRGDRGRRGQLIG
jgi:hypothetical protein